MRIRWMTAALPIGVALLLIALMAGIQLSDPVVYFRADLETLLLLVGIAISLAILLALALQNWLRTVQSSSLEHAAEDRRRFLRRLDHELKNPLMAIRAGLTNISDTQEANSEVFFSVNAQVLRLSRLAVDLRKLSELETRPLERVLVDIPQLLREVLNMAKELPMAQQRTLILTMPRLTWPIPTIVGDRDLLFLTIYNLLDNALKFSRIGDSIELRALEDGTILTLEVADTGPGIPENEIDYVWEELYRGEEAHGIPGSGLGLALVRAVVKLHGGQASLRSRPGMGTVITLRLPLR